MRLAFLVTVAVLVTAGPAAADPLVVDRTDDSGRAAACTAAPNDCSLRGAISATQQPTNTPTEQTITLPAGRFAVDTPLPNIDVQSLNIVGAGARQSVIDGGGRAQQILTGNTQRLKLTDLTVTGANAADPFIGESAVQTGGIVDLERVAIVDNKTVGLEAQLANVNDSLIARNNGAQAGGLAATGATVENSTITDNTANAVPDQPLALGAGVFTQGFALIDHSTVARNHLGPGTLPVLGVQVSGVSVTGLPVAISSSVVAGDGPSCGGLVASHGHNVGSDTTCNLTGAGDHDAVDARLGPLADNGGPTDTVALLDGSPAIDAGADCPAIDQRGIARTLGATCDAGAFESPFRAPLPAPVTPPAPPAPPVAPPSPPADKTAPKLTLSGIKKTVTRQALKKGITVKIGVDEPAVADATLLVGASRTAKKPNLEIATATLAVGRGTRTVKLRSSTKIAGKARVRASVRVVAYDLAGNRTARTVSFTVAK
jgi:hypothetical protein